MTGRPAGADHAALRLQALADTHTGWHIDADIREVVADRKRLVEQLATAEHAIEQLHSLILNSLPNDGSEIPQPDDPWWAAQLDRVVTGAARIYAASLRSE